MSLGPDTRIAYGVLHYYRGEMFFDCRPGSASDVMDHEDAQSVLEDAKKKYPGRDIRIVEIHSYQKEG